MAKRRIALGFGATVCAIVLAKRRYTLYSVDHYNLGVRMAGRLGAYAATAGYDEGTVGNTAHRAIGTIYMLFGEWAEDEIGLEFHSQRAIALYPQPIGSQAETDLNALEYAYWARQKDIGGELACMFKPSVRRAIQIHVFFRDYNIITHIEKWLRKTFT